MGRFSVEYPQHQHDVDPIARLLEFARQLEHACAQLRAGAPGEWARASRFFEHETGAYRHDLEQAVFPILKARVREEEQEEDSELVHTLMRLSAELADMQVRWHELKPLLERHTAAGVPINAAIMQRIAAYVSLWEEHVGQMEDMIIPALHALLSESDLKQLGEALARHRGIAWRPRHETEPEP